jgi:hypothetical protein
MNNGSTAALNAPMNAISSFVATPVNNVKNFASNVATNIKNTANDVASNVSTSVKSMMNAPLVKDFTEPINDSFQQAMDNNSNAAISIPIIILLGALVILFIIFLVFRNQIAMASQAAWDKIKDWFSGSTPADTAPVLPEIPMDANKLLPAKKEVFNVADNKYAYSDAEPLCKALGAELATYDQVKESWKKGADWCNYGWVKGQSAIYPTQQATYDKLQNGPEEQRMACGVPGINGGFFDNPELRFGVNCYGTKPTETGTDERRILEKQMNVAPGALEYDRKVQDYKNHRDEIAINPFKDGEWASV